VTTVGRWIDSPNILWERDGPGAAGFNGSRVGGRMILQTRSRAEGEGTREDGAQFDRSRFR
jgi:hypothetical protein